MEEYDCEYNRFDDDRLELVVVEQETSQPNPAVEQGWDPNSLPFS